MEVIDQKYLGKPINIFKKSDSSIVFQLSNGMVAKIFSEQYLNQQYFSGCFIEEKVLYGADFINNDNIVGPKQVIYDGKTFIGYTMDYISGKDFSSYKTSLSGSISLYDYACDFKKLENIVKSANKIVFTDLISRGNIIIDQNNNFNLIDFDGFQIDNYLSSMLPNGYGLGLKFLDSKYGNNNLKSKKSNRISCYTKNLDIKSLIYLYMKHVFGISLFELEGKNSCYQEEILKEIFELCSIDDVDLCDKIKMLYFSKDDNCYLGDTMFDIARKYDLDYVFQVGSKTKKLVRKR